MIVDPSGDPVPTPDAGSDVIETAFSGVTQLIIFLGGLFGLKKILGSRFALYALTALYLITRSTPRTDDDALFEKLRGATGVDQTSIDTILKQIGALKAADAQTAYAKQEITKTDLNAILKELANAQTDAVSAKAAAAKPETPSAFDPYAPTK